MNFQSENEVLEQRIKEKFYEEKALISNNLSDWFMKIIIVFSALRVAAVMIDWDFSKTHVIMSAVMLLIFLPVYKYSQGKDQLKYYIGFVFLWLIEPVSNYFSFWVYPEYDILYGMGNTILLYYGILEMAYTFHSGVIYICLHLGLWCFSGYYSGHIPYPKEADTWMTLTHVLFFHILFFHNRFKVQMESVTNKCIIERKQILINNIVQAIPEGILVTDYDLNFLLKNKSFDVLVGQNLNLQYIPQLKNWNENHLVHLSEDIRTFSKSHQQTIVFGTVRANEFKLEVTATKIMWETTPAVILTFRDVTGLIKLEKEIVENASVLQTLRGVSHELKTPLNVVINKLKLSVKEVSNPVKNDLEEALSSAKFLLFSIRDIIDFSAIKFSNYSTPNLRTNIIDTLKESIKISCGYSGCSVENIKIHLKNKVNDALFLDKHRFKQVMVSLLGKGLNISSDKIIELELFQELSALIVSVGFQCKESSVKSFLNIDENNPENAQVTVNSGLLQEITKNIIKEITKKDLTVEFSQPNRFTFKFEFPISTVSLTEQDEEIPEEGFKMYPRPPLNITKDSIVKVLVVDDIPINLQIAKSLLNGIKVECIGVLSGQEAIDLLLQKTTSTPELKVILMDCMMPDMDGWQTSSKIHELYNQKILKHLPYIIGHSAFENKQDIAKCFESGMDDFLAKPSPTSEYFNKVSRWLAEPFRLD